MEGDVLKKRVNRSMRWVGAASSAVAILDLVGMLIAMVWLSRGDYGLHTEAWWLFPFLDLATDVGVTAGVIRENNHDRRHTDTAFWTGLFLSVITFAAVYGVSPGIGAFFGDPIVGSILILYATKLLWQNVYVVPQALMRKQFRYGELSVVRVIANVGEFVAKIAFAASGAGPWAFVLASLTRIFMFGVGVQICNPWLPRFNFRWKIAKEYTGYGLRMSGSSALYYFYTNFDYVVVGKIFGAEVVGMYRLAFEIALEPVKVISDVVREVAFPAFARLRGDMAKVVDQLLVFTRLNIVTVAGYVILILLVGEDILQLVLSQDKYEAVMPLIPWLALVGLFRGLSLVIPPMLDGVGYPGRTFVYQSVAAIVLPVLYWGSATVFGNDYGVKSVAWAWLAGYPFAFAVLLIMALSVAHISAFRYFRAVSGIFACAGVAAALGFIVSWAAAPLIIWLHLPAVLITTAGTYVVLLDKTQNISYQTVRENLKKN